MATSFAGEGIETHRWVKEKAHVVYIGRYQDYREHEAAFFWDQRADIVYGPMDLELPTEVSFEASLRAPNVGQLQELKFGAQGALEFWSNKPIKNKSTPKKNGIDGTFVKFDVSARQQTVTPDKIIKKTKILFLHVLLGETLHVKQIISAAKNLNKEGLNEVSQAHMAFHAIQLSQKHEHWSVLSALLSENSTLPVVYSMLQRDPAALIKSIETRTLFSEGTGPLQALKRLEAPLKEWHRSKDRDKTLGLLKTLEWFPWMKMSLGLSVSSVLESTANPALNPFERGHYRLADVLRYTQADFYALLKSL